jgi:hypothetical protein
MMIIHHHISDVVDCGWNGRLKLAQAVRLGIGLNIGLKLCSTQLCEIIVYRSRFVVLVALVLNRVVLIDTLSYCVLAELPGTWLSSLSMIRSGRILICSFVYTSAASTSGWPCSGQMGARALLWVST